MSIILNFVYAHFFEAIAVALFGLVTKYLVKQFGKDRADAIKDAVLTAMLYAEEVFGIGHGNEKWSKAWQEIVKILQAQKIKLTEKEIQAVTVLMKSTVPEINSIVYSSLPSVAKTARQIVKRTADTQKVINDLKKKHEVKKS